MKVLFKVMRVFKAVTKIPFRKLLIIKVLKRKNLINQHLKSLIDIL